MTTEQTYAERRRQEEMDRAVAIARDAYVDHSDSTSTADGGEGQYAPMRAAIQAALTSLDPHAAEREALQERLWQALLVKIAAIQREENLRPSMRSTAMVGCHTQHPNHMSVSVYVELGAAVDDGSSRSFLITARQVGNFGNRPGQITFDIKRWMTHHEAFWNEQLANRENAFVANGQHYRIGPIRPDGDRDFAGFGGRLAIITFHDGRVVESRNLWFQGAIPAPFRDRLSDDADLTWGV